MKIALIGTSGAGKSTCLKLVGNIRGEMDCGLDTGTPQRAEAMLDWILRSPEAVIVVSVHLAGLEELAALKMSSADVRISGILFVYLFCEKAELELRLRASDCPRDLDNIEDTLNGYDKLDMVFRVLMDEIVDTTNLSISDVADHVASLC